MIHRLTHQLEALKAGTSASWRQLCQEPIAYSSLMRWRGRQRQGLPVWQSPGPKKTVPFDDAQFARLLNSLDFGPCRTAGTGELYRAFSLSLSRRQMGALVGEHRQERLDSMKHIQWLWSGLAWSIDATEYDDRQIIPVQDLASRYRLRPLVAGQLNGQQIAQHLEALFRRHGAPLLLKRDNGSPFNNQYVDELLARYWVLPLNNPPACPRYNGAQEKSIRDLKEHLQRRWGSAPANSADLSSELMARIENSVHELNHQARRCLKGRTPCVVFHDGAQRLRWTVRQRQIIFRLLLSQFGRMIGTVPKDDHRKVATLWRVTLQAWLRRQGLISVRQNQKPKVSTNFPENWSHN
jgi:transposase InsO family protein